MNKLLKTLIILLPLLFALPLSAEVASSNEKAQITLAAVFEAGGEAVQVKKWTVYDAQGHANGKQKMVTYSFHKEPTVALLAGEYVAKFVKDKIKIEHPFSVKAGQVTREEVILGKQSKVTLAAVLSEGGEALNVQRWVVYNATPAVKGELAKITSSFHKTPTLTLLPGEYLARATKDNTTTEKTFTVAAGSTSREEIIVAKHNRITLAAVLEAGAIAVPIKKWTIYQASSDGELVKVDDSYQKTPTFPLQAGKYVVRVTKAKVTQEQEFVVEPDTDANIEVVLPAQGRVTFSAAEKNGGKIPAISRWDVYATELDVDGSKKRIEASGKASPTMTLLPGKYDVIATLEDKRTASTRFSLMGHEDKQVNVVIE